MLKQIHKVACAPALDACNRLQMELLAWLCDPNVQGIDITNANLAQVLTGRAIETDWLWEFLQKEESKQSLLLRAQAIADMPIINKAALLSWAVAIVDVAAQFQSTPAVWPPSPPVLTESQWSAFKTLMEAFYEKGLRSGLPYDATGAVGLSGGVRYKDFVTAFKLQHQTNPSPDAKGVCVYCGGELGGSPQVDHWINKSSAPVLSVAANNLVLVCTQCNSPSNKAKKAVHDNGVFTQWFHPFHRPGHGAFRLSYDAAIWRVVCIANDVADNVKTENMDRLLNLTDRWTTEFKAEYVRQQGVLYRRERSRIKNQQARQTQSEVTAYVEQVNDDLDCTYPHYEVHNVLCTAMRDIARSAAWQTELELMK
jgi:hypothetical protein